MNAQHILRFVGQTAILVAVMITVGCAWVPQEARIKIDTGSATSEAGRGVRVAVKVYDRRPDTVLGYRGVDTQNAAITTKQNLVVLFRDAIIEGLSRKGFKATDYDGETPRVLSVEIRKVEYSTDMEFWKGVVKTEAWLVASMTRGGARFEQNYVGTRKQTTVEAPRAKTNERLLNEAVSEAVNALVNDPSLLRFMAE